MGPAGAAGPQGPAGPAGPNGSVFINVVTATASGTVTTFPVLIEATCPTGKRAIGASYSVNSGSFYASYSVTTFRPTLTGWQLGVAPISIGAGSVPISVTVSCATILS